jgi:hypothetical protein
MNKRDMNNGKGGGADMNKQDMNSGAGKDQKTDGKDGGGMPGMKDGMGGGGGMGQTGGMDPKGGSGQPKDGQANGGRRPRAGSQPKDGKDPGGSATAGKEGGTQPRPMNPGNATAKANNSKDPVGGTAVDGKTDRPPPPIQPQLPLADEVAKEVWGHLPERLRQQMSQYYREEFMPRYSGLLRQYYSSLANSPAGPSPAPPPPPMPR